MTLQELFDRLEDVQMIEGIGDVYHHIKDIKDDIHKSGIRSGNITIHCQCEDE